jgi:hypothetical protein
MINTMSCTPSEAISAINALWPLLLEEELCRAWNYNLAGLRSETLSHDDFVEVDIGVFESYPFRERRLE